MEIRVWKYLDNNKKQLIDLIKSNNVYFLKKMLKELKEVYSYYNYEIEKVGFKDE